MCVSSVSVIFLVSLFNWTTWDQIIQSMTVWILLKCKYCTLYIHTRHHTKSLHYYCKMLEFKINLVGVFINMYFNNTFRVNHRLFCGLGLEYETRLMKNKNWKEKYFLFFNWLNFFICSQLTWKWARNDMLGLYISLRPYDQIKGFKKT